MFIVEMADRRAGFEEGLKRTSISINLKDLDLNSEQKTALHAVDVQKRNNLCHTYEAEVQNVQI